MVLLEGGGDGSRVYIYFFGKEEESYGVREKLNEIVSSMMVKKKSMIDNYTLFLAPLSLSVFFFSFLPTAICSLSFSSFRYGPHIYIQSVAFANLHRSIFYIF